MSTSESSLRQHGDPRKTVFLADYYRKTILSGGMVHFTLGVALIISWFFTTDLFFQSELAAGVCFSVSGIVAIACGKLRLRLLDRMSLISSILSAFSTLALFFIIIYILYESKRHALANPWVGIFIIYSMLGFVFAVLLVMYSNLAVKASKRTTFRQRRSTGTEETIGTPITKVTATPEDNGVEAQHRMSVPSTSSKTDLSRTLTKSLTTSL